MLVVGDVCIDKYVHVSCNRLNPESPATLYDIDKEYSHMGMAAIVAQSCENFGLDVCTSFPSELSTKTRYVATSNPAHQFLRVDTNVKSKPKIWSQADENVFDAVVISDYNKGYIDDTFIKEAIAKAGCPVFLDTKKTNLEPFAGAIIKVNEYEYNRADTNYDTCLIVTGGSDGCEYHYRGSIKEQHPGFNAKCVDVCSAGDNFLAGLVYGAFTASSVLGALAYANAAGAACVEQEGSGPVYYFNLQEMLRR